MNVNIMPGLPRYGAAELLEVHQRFMLGALLAACMLELTGLGAWRMWQRLNAAEPDRVVTMEYDPAQLPPAPPVNVDWEAVKEWMLPKPDIRRTNGMPVPVPDAAADPDKTVPTQIELGMEGLLTPPIPDGPDVIHRIKPDLNIDGPPNSVVPFEKEPVCILRVNPTYPEVARLAGLEGSVYVKLWIDKTGKVRQVVLLKSDNPIFDQAVIEAAKQWVFTPAMMNAGPVAVWMSMPFHFALR
ncbi:TonB family protein [bacterium]|nr:TonB family protein [bacterium]